MAAPKESNDFLKSTFPVTLPVNKALKCNDDQFDKFITTVTKKSVSAKNISTTSAVNQSPEENSMDTSTLVSETAEIREGIHNMDVSNDELSIDHAGAPQHPFVQALRDSNVPESRDMSNTMLTENRDVAFAKTKDPLVDLFFELEEVIAGDKLRDLLEAAWKSDALSTLKIIFNARSIHIGKSSRASTYKCFGWLAQNHPVTLLTNLKWLCRPIIEKKIGEKQEEEKQVDGMVLVEKPKSENDITRFDVQNGVSHGYWKDLLNILALTIDGKLDVMANPRDLLNIENKGVQKKDFVWDQEKAKKLRDERKTARHAAVVKEMEQEGSFYQALHLTVARLFSGQLKSDLALLRSNDKKAIRQISLCAKWAPSSGLFHDKHTFIVSSIAEILHPQIEGLKTDDREIYLRHAREAYRRDISALRKALEVVERDITANTLSKVKYEQVPSLAMNQYAGLFATKDSKHFDEYISKVAEGKASISGATLLPSTLIAAVRGKHSHYNSWQRTSTVTSSKKKKKGTKDLIEAKQTSTNAKVLDGQWNTLVKRIKDSGNLDNCIAVCDVSGSMTSPIFPDKSCPMDSAIGLSLLLAEVTKAPFGGQFITFSDDPKLVSVQGTSLVEKVSNMEQAEWGGSTNFVAVFEKLILPQARKFNLKQEDMVKRIFIFSDMQFNYAEGHSDRWSTSYERIKKQFELYKYEMPELVFWNLAGGRGDNTAPKPVTAGEEGTSLVSGYSQGLLKVFLDNGAFEDPDAEEEIIEEVVAGEDSEEEVKVTKKKKVDPSSTVRKAISHKAYSMLKVVD